MVFKTLIGSTKRLSKPKRYVIDWAKPSRSKLQTTTKLFIKDYWLHDVVFEEFPMVGSKLTFDFYNANKNIAIEVQGGQHLKYIPFFHGKSKSNFLGQIRRDNEKEKFCAINSINLVEIYPDDKLSIKLFESFGVIL